MVIKQPWIIERIKHTAIEYIESNRNDPIRKLAEYKLAKHKLE